MQKQFIRAFTLSGVLGQGKDALTAYPTSSWKALVQILKFNRLFGKKTNIYIDIQVSNSILG